jgi:signal transduction histidine kinase
MNSNDVIFWVVLPTLIILLLVAGMFIVFFIAGKQRLMQEAKMAQMQIDYEKELRLVQQEVQEQVLSNVGAELHDNIGQLLTVMHIQLEQKKLVMPDAAGILNPLQESLGNITQQVKVLGRTLNSDVVEQNGLLYMMDLELERIRQTKSFTVKWTNDNTEPVLNKDQRLMVFRIFQEVLNNALKHSQATNIDVSLHGQGKFLLCMKDDGVGFDTEDMLQSGKGAGLRNIPKRAALAGMECSTDAAKGKGTIFTLQQI